MNVSASKAHSSSCWYVSPWWERQTRQLGALYGCVQAIQRNFGIMNSKHVGFQQDHWSVVSNAEYAMRRPSVAISFGQSVRRNVPRQHCSGWYGLFVPLTQGWRRSHVTGCFQSKHKCSCSGERDVNAGTTQNMTKHRHALAENVITLSRWCCECVCVSSV